METQIVYDKCKKCGKELSPQEKLDCEKIKFIPFCAEHLKIYVEQFRKCSPLLQKMNLQ